MQMTIAPAEANLGDPEEDGWLDRKDRRHKGAVPAWKLDGYYLVFWNNPDITRTIGNTATILPSCWEPIFNENYFTTLVLER